MKKYEYKIVKIEMKSKLSFTLDVETNEAILTGLGLEGWRLINTSASGGSTACWVMERELE